MTNPQPVSDLNLLFGMLALQMDFITRDQLLSAMSGWVMDKNKSVGTILLEQNVLTSDRHALLTALVKEHLKLHGNDPQQSLAAVSSVASVEKDLERIADTDVQASLLHLPRREPQSGDPFATVAPVVGASTSAGLRFRILRPHAKGGLGEVFVAHDEELHREVALKEIQDRHADNPESRTRFLLEAEITGGLEHPGIVPVYGLGQYADGRPYYAMRFIRGDSLHDAIDKYHKPHGKTPCPAAQAIAFRNLLGRFIDVCNAIQYAHDRGVLHRDLKPGNVMLGKYGETLVVDWGLAKATGAQARPYEPLAATTTGTHPPSTTADEPALQPRSTSGSSETVAGSAVGTPQYMSPEQAAGRLDLLGPASDVYSLGATLYYLLTGKVPFPDRDVGAVLAAVQKGDFPAPRQVKGDVARPLDAICRKAMALKSADRYGSTLALARDVEQWLADEPVSAYAEPWRIRTGRWVRRHRTMVTTVVVASLLLVAGLVTVYVLEQRRLKQAEEYLASVKTFAENEEQLAKAEVNAGHFKSADGILKQICDRLQAEPNLEGMRARLLKRQERIHRLTEFYKYADEVERWVQEAKPAEALAAGEKCLELVEVTRHPNWWDNLPGEDLTPAQHEQLRDETYRQLHVVAALRATRETGAPTTEDLKSALDLCERIERFKPSHCGQLLKFACLFGLGDFSKEFTMPPGEPTSAVDHYFLGFLHWAAVVRPDNRLSLLLAKIPSSANLTAEQHMKRAEEHFRKAITLEPRHSFTYVFLINTLIRARNYAEAELAANAAVGQRPEYEINYLVRAVVITKQAAQAADPEARKRLIDRALADIDTAIRLNASYAEPYHLRAQIREQMKQFDKAMEDYNQAILLRPKDDVALGARGMIYYNQKRYDRAIADFDAAIRLKPNWLLYNNRGASYLHERDYAQGLADLNEAIKLNAKAANPHNHRGTIYLVMREYKKALADFQQAVSLNPKYADACSHLAWLLATCPEENLRDGKKAVEYATKACALTAWKEPRQLTVLAAAHAEAGQFADAVRRQQEALAVKDAFTVEERATQQTRLALYLMDKAFHE